MLFHDGDQRCLHVGGERQPGLQRRRGAGPRRGRQRRQPVDLRGDDARAVAGGGVVGAVVGRTQRRAVAAAARPPARRAGGAGPLRRRTRSPTTTRWRGSGSGRRPAGRSSRSRWSRPVARAAAPTRRDGSRRAALPPRDRHRVAAHVVLGADPRRRDDAGVSSEPEVVELDDEVGRDPGGDAGGPAPDVPSPMADLPTGAKFGTLVHAVLETADPFAADLAAELEAQIREHSVWWPVDVPAAELAAAMVPMHDTPLGPLADGADAAADRAAGPDAGDGLRVPVGRRRSAGRRRRTSGWPTSASCCGRTCRADDPLASYADRLTGAALGGQSLRGYCRGSVDAVLRIRTTGTWWSTTRRTGSATRTEPLTAADYAPAAAGRGDAAFGLSAAGAAVQRCAAPVPAVAAARV